MKPLPYIKAYVDRHGRPHWYYRRKGFPSVTLPQPGSPGFLAIYEAANAREQFAFDPGKIKFLRGSLGWVIDQFVASDQFQKRGASTMRGDRNCFDELKKEFGGGLLKDLRAKHVKVIRNHFHKKNTASVADEAVSRLSTLWRFADDRLDLELEANPTVGIARLHKRDKDKEYQPWTDEVFAAFDATAPAQLRLAVLLGRYTGQRRSDVVNMKWAQFDGESIEVPSQEKTGAYVKVPCHKELRTVLKAMKRRGEYILATERGGHQYNAASLAELVGRQLKRIGIKGFSFHGLRKNAAIALTEAGATVEEVMAVTGHRSAKMAMHYSKRAQKKLLASNAVRKWEAADAAKKIRAVK